jgi:DNA-binding response OmpR family regulator
MGSNRLILTVDHNQRNQELLAQFLGKAGYQTIGVSTLEQLDTTINDSPTIGLALVDISGFDRSIWQHCEQLRTKNIPLLVLSPRYTATLQQESLAHGARSMLIKPLVVKELLGLIRSLLEE